MAEKKTLESFFPGDLNWVNKEISWYVKKSDFDADTAILFAKNYPKNSEEDEKFTKDLPEAYKGMKINGKLISDMIKNPEKPGFFKNWNRPNKGTLVLINIFKRGEGWEAQSMAIFGSKEPEEVWRKLYAKAQGAIVTKGTAAPKVMRAKVWEDVIPGIKGYSVEKEKQKEERKKAKEAEAAKEAKEGKPSATKPSATAPPATEGVTIGERKEEEAPKTTKKKKGKD